MIQLLRSYIGYTTLLCFVVSGLVVNIGLLLIFILIRPFSVQLFRKCNAYLQYSCWSQPVAIADWFSNLKCRVYYADDESRRLFCQRSSIVIGNHRYDIDWLAAWMLSDKLGTLGNDKAMLKASLKYVPIIGWGWALSDMIFLSRDWKKDQFNLIKHMKVMLTYPRSPVLAYYEGTRFTKQKQAASIKFAEEKGLDIQLKHHLIPRSRGFNCMMKLVNEEKKKNPKLNYDLFSMEVGIDNDDNKSASMAAVLAGSETTVHIYVKRLNPDNVDFNSEQEATKYLFDIFKEKDEIFDYFLKNKKFPGIEVPYKPRICSLLNISAWLIFTYCLVIYLYYICFTSGSLLSMVLFSMLGLGTLVSIKLLLNSTQVSRSSAYGTKTK